MSAVNNLFNWVVQLHSNKALTFLKIERKGEMLLAATLESVLPRRNFLL
jgi:hypothetical protein